MWLIIHDVSKNSDLLATNNLNRLLLPLLQQQNFLTHCYRTVPPHHPGTPPRLHTTLRLSSACQNTEVQGGR